MNVHLNELPFTLTVLMGTAEVPMEALAQLQVGDILLLEQRVDEAVTIEVGEEYRFRGRLGLNKIQKAVKIDEQIHI